MYVFFFLLFLLLLIFFCINFYRRKKIIKKICSMCTEEKCCLLETLLEPFGYTYSLSQDIFSSRLDSWQRNFGYCALYDNAARRFGMIFDSLPVYFDYHNKTWLMEFWKGQYGINTGAEAGVYYADHILDESEYATSLFQSVTNPDMPVFSFRFFRNGTQVAELSKRHWWLTSFLLGCFTNPADLCMSIGVTFRNRTMRNAFIEGLIRAGYSQNDIQLSGNTVLFSFTRTTQETNRLTRLSIRFVQWKNRFWCNVYLHITKPFCLSLDRILYLYYFLPFCFRKILHIRHHPKRKDSLLYELLFKNNKSL